MGTVKSPLLLHTVSRMLLASLQTWRFYRHQLPAHGLLGRWKQKMMSSLLCYRQQSPPHSMPKSWSMRKAMLLIEKHVAPLGNYAKAAAIQDAEHMSQTTRRMLRPARLVALHVGPPRQQKPKPRVRLARRRGRKKRKWNWLNVLFLKSL